MKRVYTCIAAAIVLICLQSIPALARNDWNIMTEELPPYNFSRQDQVHGISADILLQIMKENNQHVERKDIRLLPWPRAYRMVQDVPGSILFSTARTAEREDLFQWVGPITDLTIGLTALKSRNITLNSLDDLQQYTIGTIRDGAPEQLLIQSGVDADRLDRIAGPEANIKKLEAGRIDLFAFSVPSTQFLMLKLGIDPDKYESVYTLKQADLYYAFHKETDKTLIQALNATLKAMQQPDATGRSEVDRIISRYLSK